MTSRLSQHFYPHHKVDCGAMSQHERSEISKQKKEEARRTRQCRTIMSLELWVVEHENYECSGRKTTRMDDENFTASSSPTETAMMSTTSCEKLFEHAPWMLSSVGSTNFEWREVKQWKEHVHVPIGNFRKFYYFLSLLTLCYSVDQAHIRTSTHLIHVGAVLSRKRCEILTRRTNCEVKQSSLVSSSRNLIKCKPTHDWLLSRAVGEIFFLIFSRVSVKYLKNLCFFSSRVDWKHSWVKSHCLFLCMPFTWASNLCVTVKLHCFVESGK